MCACCRLLIGRVWPNDEAVKFILVVVVVVDDVHLYPLNCVLSVDTKASKEHQTNVSSSRTGQSVWVDCSK